MLGLRRLPLLSVYYYYIHFDDFIQPERDQTSWAQNNTPVQKSLL